MVRTAKIINPPGEMQEWAGLYTIYKEMKDDAYVYVVYMETLSTQVYAYSYISEHDTLDGARAAVEGARRGQ